MSLYLVLCYYYLLLYVVITLEPQFIVIVKNYSGVRFDLFVCG